MIRLILDYIFAAFDLARSSYATLPYGMVLTRIFQRGQLSVDDHRKDEKHPVTTMKTFTTMGLKPQAQEEGRKKKKKEEREEGREEGGEGEKEEEETRASSEGKNETF